MGRYGCKICDDKVAARAIDEELAKGESAAYVARLMTLRGFSVVDQTVLEHKKHSLTASTAVIAAKGSRKHVSKIVEERVVAKLEADPNLDLTDKDIARMVGLGLKAEAEVNKQLSRVDDRKTAIAIAFILSGASGGGPPEHLLIGDGDVIEGEATEVFEDE